MTSASDTCSMDKDTCPDSITARSRISLISFSRCHPAWRIWEIRAAWEAVGNGTADSISCAKPRIALSGLRSSWLMLERKSDLARLALSATTLADEEWSEQVKERIRLRRYEPVVRLEFGPGSNPEIRRILCD